MLAGPYRIPNVEVTFASVYTHPVPVTPYCGTGQHQMIESGRETTSNNLAPED